MAEDFGPHGALQDLVSVDYSLPKDGQGNLTIPSQAAADYLDEQPKIIPHDKTWREKTVDWAADKMMEYGASPQSAYKYSRKVFGGGNELMGIGVADVTPAGLVFAGEEAVRGYEKGDVVMPTVELALSAVEAYPLTKAILKPARKLVQAPNAPVDESRRRFMKGAAKVAGPAAIVAGGLGALSQMPSKKIAEGVSEIKAAKITKAPKITPNFDFLADNNLDDVNWSDMSGNQIFDAVKDIFKLGDSEALDLIEKTGYFGKKSDWIKKPQFLDYSIWNWDNYKDIDKMKHNLQLELSDVNLGAEDVDYKNQLFLDFIEDVADNAKDK